MSYWVQKYSPKKTSEVIGQYENIKKLYIFASQFPRVRKRAILMHGGSGVGKTSASYALASEMNWEIVELNASDVINESKYPIVITANNAFSSKLKTLRRYCDLIEFKPIPDLLIIARLKQLCALEGVEYEEAAIRKLAGASDGDLRSAINDLQIMSEGRKKINLEDIKLWGREREENIMNLMKLVYKSFDSDLLLTTSNYVSDDIINFIYWLDENITKEYKRKDELAYAYKKMAEADSFLARIRRRQHWRFLIYARILSLVGVQQEKITPNRQSNVYTYPDVLLKIYQRASKRKKIQMISELATQKLHSSTDRLTKTFWPYFDYMQQKNPSYAEEILEYIEPSD